MAELFARIQKGTFKKFPSGVSGAFKDLVSRLLVPNPRERLQISEIQEHEWYISGQTPASISN